MIYADWTASVGAIFEIPITAPATASPSSNDGFNTIYPRAIEYAELRIQRDLDLQSTTATDSTGVMTANNRKVTLPTTLGTFVVVEEIIPIVGGQRGEPLQPISRAGLDFAFPATTTAAEPIYWTPNDQLSVYVGPAPDLAYGFEAVGTVRFTPMSSTNTSNFLTLYLPDLYLAASCVFLAGYQRDFGAQSEDPRLSQSWESQYQTLMKSADVEEARKKLLGKSPSDATPQPPPSS